MSLFVAENRNCDAWFLHYDIAPTHVMFAAWEFLAKQSIITNIFTDMVCETLTIPRTEDHFETRQISGHVVSMPEECFQLCSE